MNFDAVTADEVHNFAFVQSIYAMLGNFPKVKVKIVSYCLYTHVYATCFTDFAGISVV